jgi:nicotinamidase-related amidase
MTSPMRPVLVVVDVQNGLVRDSPGSQYERLFGWTSLQGPPETDIVPELAEQPERATAIVDKQIYSLFTPYGSELVRRHGWTDLYICGIATESCVLKTAADAFEQGDITPWIIQDASASHAGSAAHDAGITVAARFIGLNQIIRIADLPTHVLPPQRAA